MFRLLLLLLVGTIYAQELDAYDHSKAETAVHGDLEETAVQGDLEETAVQGDLEETVVQEDLEETACTDSQEDESDISDDLQTSDQDKCHNVGVFPGKGTCSYRVFRRLRKFWRAQHICRCSRGNLSSLHSFGANNQVRCLVKRKCTNLSYAWIGVYKVNNCVRNVDGSRVNYTNWSCGLNQSTGRCVAMNLSTGRWVFLPCNTRLPFVCTV
ncbi:bone marrow proteoglycan-like [Pseudophryne corroboree]|uniref:bone marrow proteoglycan-like n=1 Tax=Pseudophryne corroboree TaxID=495146 RepID=UPI003081E4C8